MSKKKPAPTTVTTEQLQGFVRQATKAAKGASVNQGGGAHGGPKSDQHRQDRQGAKLTMRFISAGGDIDQFSRKDRKGKTSMMREVRKK